jgi:hypothetical protein
MEEARLAQAEEACSYALFPALGSDLPVELAEIIALVTEQTSSYIWHRETFGLHTAQGRLQGRTRVGDCVDDEWLIVWLLRELTKARPSLVARSAARPGCVTALTS